MARLRKTIKKEKCLYCGSQKRVGKPCLSSWCSAMRMAQTPDDIRLWWQVAGPAIFALLVANGILATEERCPEVDPRDDKGLKIVRRIERWGLECARTTGDHGLVTRQWAAVQRDRLFNYARATFGSAKIRLDISTEVALSLVDDARAALPESWDPTPWNWLECALTALNKELDPDMQGADGALEAYEQMREFMFSETKKAPAAAPKLYLVGGRILTVAYNRPQAREQVTKDLGLVMRAVQGLDPRAKCVDENGIPAGTYGDVLAEAVRTQPKLPTVIGRAA
jgi:hypothetical protein